MSDDQFSFLIKLSITFLILIWILYVIIKAFRRGQISYNVSKLRWFGWWPTTNTFIRKDSPFGFWTGIFLFSFLGLIDIAIAAAIILSFVFGLDVLHFLSLE